MLNDFVKNRDRALVIQASLRSDRPTKTEKFGQTSKPTSDKMDALKLNLFILSSALCTYVSDTRSFVL